MELPVNYQTVMPYVLVSGANKFIDFTKSVFGAVEVLENRTMRDENIIQHGEIMIGGCMIMFADSNDQFPPLTASLFIYVADADQTYEKALEAGASSIMPLSNQPYGRTCGILDPFGNSWWVTSILK